MCASRVVDWRDRDLGVIWALKCDALGLKKKFRISSASLRVFYLRSDCLEVTRAPRLSRVGSAALRNSFGSQESSDGKIPAIRSSREGLYFFIHVVVGLLR